MRGESAVHVHDEHGADLGQLDREGRGLTIGEAAAWFLQFYRVTTFTILGMRKSLIELG